VFLQQRLRETLRADEVRLFVTRPVTVRRRGRGALRARGRTRARNTHRVGPVVGRGGKFADRSATNAQKSTALERARFENDRVRSEITLGGAERFCHGVRLVGLDAHCVPSLALGPQDAHRYLLAASYAAGAPAD
jgi:hypothetical protein